MFIAVNGHLFDRLGYCKLVKLAVKNDQKIDYKDTNKNLVDKHLVHEQLINMAIGKMNAHLKELEGYHPVTKLATFIVPELSTGEDNDIKVATFNCDETDIDGIREMVAHFSAANMLPAVIIGLSKEDLATVTINDTVMMLLAVSEGAVNKTAVATVEILPYDIPDVFNTPKLDENSWGMIFPAILINPETNEIFSANSDYAAFDIYEYIKKDEPAEEEESEEPDGEPVTEE